MVLLTWLLTLLVLHSVIADLLQSPLFLLTVELFPKVLLHVLFCLLDLFCYLLLRVYLFNLRRFLWLCFLNWTELRWFHFVLRIRYVLWVLSVFLFRAVLYTDLVLRCLCLLLMVLQLLDVNLVVVLWPSCSLNLNDLLLLELILI